MHLHPICFKNEFVSGCAFVAPDCQMHCVPERDRGQAPVAARLAMSGLNLDSTRGSTSPADWACTDMQASAVAGGRESVVTDYMLKLLGLDVCAGACMYLLPI